MAEMWMNTVVSFIDCIKISRSFIYYWVMILEDIRYVLTLISPLWHDGCCGSCRKIPTERLYHTIMVHPSTSPYHFIWNRPTTTEQLHQRLWIFIWVQLLPNNDFISWSYLYDWIEHLNLEFELNDNCVHSNCWWNVSFSKYILIDRAGYRTEWRECSDESSSTAPDPAVLVALLADLL